MEDDMNGRKQKWAIASMEIKLNGGLLLEISK
jgi:hypothetical protein